MKRTKDYRVCWGYKGRKGSTCRVLSAKQHANAREAAETVLQQNPNARVTVVSPRGGGRGTTYKLNRRTGRAVRGR